MINPWHILGVHLKSTDEEIRLAYLGLAKVLHPDKRGGDARAFTTLNQAYSQIAKKKDRYALLEKLMCTASMCTKCGGAGCSSKTKGFTEKVYKSCSVCGGAGFIIKEKEKENVTIEL